MFHVSKPIHILPNGQVIPGPGTTYRAHTERAQRRALRRKGILSARQMRKALKEMNRDEPTS